MEPPMTATDFLTDDNIFHAPHFCSLVHADGQFAANVLVDFRGATLRWCWSVVGGGGGGIGFASAACAKKAFHEWLAARNAR